MEISNTAQRLEDSKSIFGFWVYLMTDCVLFASLFATYAVMHGSNFGGPTPSGLFSMQYALIETLLLLTSSFSCGLAVLAAQKNKKNWVVYLLILTFILGLSFLTLEIHEFNKFINMGDSWRRSGFLSSFFTLVGTHGLHITAGLIWMGVMISRISSLGSFTKKSLRQLTMLSLFWHFLDVVWIFIFSIVYLYGGLGL